MTLKLLLIAIFSATAWSASIADTEQDLLQILRSTDNPVEKADAAARLRSVGSAQAVPALAALLQDKETAHAARHALEGIPAVEAGDALRQALIQSAFSPGGLNFADPAGIIDSLGWRGEPESVPLLQRILAESESYASAAATALGRIGNDAALAALENALDKVRPDARPAVFEALLRCADRQVQSGQRTRAISVYRALFDTAELEPVRAAAYAGLIRCADDGGLDLILAALGGDDVAAERAALPLAVDLRSPGATEAFMRLLPEASRTRQVALLVLLESRGDKTALPAFMTAAHSPYPEVRAAAISALGTLGDASCIDLLIEAATSQDAGEQSAARLALAVLRSDGVTPALIAALGSAKPNVQQEAARALSARADSAAVPALLDLVAAGESASRRAAFQALGQLVDTSHMNSLVRLLIDSKSQSARDQIRGLFQSLVDRSQDAQPDLQPLLDGLNSGITESRMALLPVSILFIDERVRVAVRSALQDSNAEVRDAAARALCESSDPALLPDMISLARQATDPTLRSLAINGSLRLTTDNEVELAKQQRIHALTEIFALGNRPEDRRRVLSALARVPDVSTLKLAAQATEESAVRVEAELACLQIARALGSSEFDAVQVSLARLSADAADPNVRSNALAALKQLDSGWLFAGPYRVPGRQAQELFDVEFAPESPREASDVVWRRAPGSLDLARPDEVDLSSITEGDHCVVYLKTRIHAPSAQDVVLAIGSDDGIKLWVNGDLVHANNAVRGLTPGQDQARARLREGWNDLLAKITQHTLGCGMTLRVTAPTGAEIPELRRSAQ